MIKKLNIFLILIFLVTSSYAKDSLIELNIKDLSKIKRGILLAANEMQATNEEKSITLAIASIETEAMAVDYPDGDNKKGDAYNVSIYKMNVGMIRAIDSSINPKKINLDNEASTKTLIKGIRKFGLDRFLYYHRGGETAFKKDVQDYDVLVYVNAIKQIAKKYLSVNNQLDSNKTDDIRYTIMVPAI